MTENNLAVRVNADTEHAVEAINEVTEAVEELEAALNRLKSRNVSVGVELSSEDGSTVSSSNTFFRD